jgi:hypothetical protein
MMNSGGIPAELSHSGLIPADSGNSGLILADSGPIPADSGPIPADSGAIPPESAGITGFRTESVGHQKVQTDPNKSNTLEDTKFRGVVVQPGWFSKAIQYDQIYRDA